MTRRKNVDQHRLNGTLRSHQRGAPEPSPEPLPPSWLGDRAAQLWRLHAKALSDLGLLTPLDAQSFGTWCATQAIVEKAVSEDRIPTRDQLAGLRALASQFGLTPESRARILGIAPQAPRRKPSEFDDLDDPRRSKFDDVDLRGR